VSFRRRLWNAYGRLYDLGRLPGALKEELFKVPHAHLGALVILMLVLTPASGILQLRAAREKKAKIRRVHRTFGRTALLLMALNMLFLMLIASLA